MAEAKLTDLKVKKIKATDRVQTFSDGAGLQLRVSQAGTKTWKLAYRHEGVQKSMIFGPYPLLSLSDARQKRDEAKRLLLDGIDPGAAKQEIKKAVEVETNSVLVSVAEGYFAKLTTEGRTEATLEKNRWLFSFIPEDLRARSIATIKAPDLLPPLRALEARGLTQSATRLRGLLGSIFRYGAANGLCDSDPTLLLHGALARHETKSRAAVTDVKKFGSLIRAIWSYEGQPETVACLKLLALVVSRPGELRMAEWSEFDLEAGVWEVPAGRMKMRRPFKTPLSPQAVVILKAHKEVVRQGKLLFPGLRAADRPISENTTNGALRRLGFSKEEASSHGFRASFSTIANESGLWSADAIERQLAHIETNEVRRAYARGENFEERVRMMAWWADQIDAMRGAA